MKKHFLWYSFFFLLLGTSTLFAQKYTAHYLVNAGYTYHKNYHGGELGGRVLLLKEDDIAYRLGVSALMGKYDGTFTVMPKGSADILFNYQKGRDISHAVYYVAGVDATTHFITPKVGAALLGLLEIDLGYMFPYNSRAHLPKGFTMNLGLSIPLVVFE
ncbi:hypothetical protein [Bergeyella zoohelcum]|uniref:Outer membrane protein beta-barrel domain-containing protein n=1 Tax=Bergeyella zoohelcum ATCC 43767 TaxID=883096 RepID=K1MRA2_9FLAO|nr:hypothetical protein [Bergeyella zoohelcum]EKB58669.1 hypothetical protein HMPREF9699_00569 [Bergeyella zoohelcum ATCC 43767]SUV49241.1 Uncharacterised protein [Bergeyella zoohelcum]